ncbi:MAG: caspase family protein [Geminicoccaceae bacterium]
MSEFNVMAMSKPVRFIFCQLLVIPMLLISAFAAMADAAEEKRVALVIGNNAYTHATPLDNSRNDAEAIAEALVRLDFDTVSSLDLDQHGMQTALRDFEERIKDADVALFYYAGHGLQTHGKNYLVSTNADLRSESDLQFNTIDLQIVIDFMQDPDRTNIIILDACRDNSLADQLALSLPKSRSNGVARGLAKVESGVGTLVAFATAPGDDALDGLGPHSPFSESLLQHIETPGLEVRQLFSRVRDDVYRSTDGDQVPWDNSSLRSDFYFNPAIQPAVVAKSPEPAAETVKAEFLFWDTIKDDQTPENYAEFVRLFPDSIFTSVARQRLAALRDPNERQIALQEETVPQPAAKPAPAPAPEIVTALASSEADLPKTRVMSIETPLAKTIADGWRRRPYALRGRNVHGCHGTGSETARVGDWKAIEPDYSPVKFENLYENGVAAFSAETFDVSASLGVQAEDGEVLLVEYKKAVGVTSAWCAYEALSEELFSNVLAATDYFSGQDLTTTHTGFTKAGWMEFAFGLVVVEGAEGPRNCMTFAGFQGSKRVDGFFCRDIGVAIDASEIDSILARIKIDGVIG